jgi:hypothetical protein
VAKPRQNGAIVPERAKRRRVQALHGANQFLSDFRRIPAERIAYPIHRSEQIHHQRHRSSSGALEQQSGATLAQNSLRYFPSFKHGIDFHGNSTELPLRLEVCDKRLKVLKRHEP